jgi:probable rRNA maturation factor
MSAGVKGGLAGDLAISIDTAARQAREQGHTLSIELRVLMLHGLLHLAGHDHETDKGQMAKAEQKLRAQLRLPSGLIERASSSKPETAPVKRLAKKAAR